MASSRVSDTRFALFLKKQFSARQNKNPNYSLRAFARDLQISASLAWSLINEKKPLTKAMKTKLGKRLGLSVEEINSFRHSPDKTNPVIYKSPDPIQNMEGTTIKVMSEWYHYAILELTKTRDFLPSVEGISKALHITINEAKSAVDTLFDLGFLEVDGKGNWYDASEKKGTLSNIENNSAEVKKSIQAQFLERSKHALQNVPTNLRNHTTMTMAISIDDLPRAIERIREFRRALCSELELSSDPTDVYSLQISLFPESERSK